MPESGISRNSNNRRDDWEKNHLLIMQCIQAGLNPKDPKTKPSIPSMLEISVATGLGLTTCYEHSASLEMKELRGRSRLMAESIFMRQALKAYSTGGENAAKTFFKLNFDWAEKTETKVSGAVDLNVSIEAIKARQQALLDGEAAEAEFDDMDDRVVTDATENGENVINLLQNPEQEFPETANAEPE